MPRARTLIPATLIVGVLASTARGNAISTPGTSGTGFTLAQATAPGPTASSVATGRNLASSASTNQASSASAPSAPQTPAYDAFINLGAGPFADAGLLTTGGDQPWYQSSKVAALFGGTPDAQQRADFDAAVLQRVERTFQLGGVPVRLTDDPSATAAHSMSVVADTVNPSIGQAIGMTTIGGNGFHFIDNAAGSARSVDQLEWIVAHNVAHELMLAFGVPENYDRTGRYVDSTVGQMAMFLNPDATFSGSAAQALLSVNFREVNGSSLTSSPQLIEGTPVPEPATWAMWALGSIAAAAAANARSRRASA